MKESDRFVDDFVPVEIGDAHYELLAYWNPSEANMLYMICKGAPVSALIPWPGRVLSWVLILKVDPKVDITEPDPRPFCLHLQTKEGDDLLFDGLAAHEIHTAVEDIKEAYITVKNEVSKRA